MNLCRERPVFTAGHFAKKGKECSGRRIREKATPSLAGARCKTYALAFERFVSGDGDGGDDAMQIAAARCASKSSWHK